LGEFFPPHYKEYAFKEGDVFACESDDGYWLKRVLKVDRADFKQGQAINIQGKLFPAAEDDYLLIVSLSFGNAEFNNLDEARGAFNSRKWKIRVGHAPVRTSNELENAIYLGNFPVADSELDGYKEWKNAFDKGEAGIF
jgi:hypothetical protein